MRILAFTDIHGADAEVERILRQEDPADLVILGGDLTTFGSASDAEETIRMVRDFCPSVFAVGGNMDPWALEQTFVDLDVSLNGRGTMLGDVGFFGVSGAPLSPLHTPHELPEDEIREVALRGWAAVADARIRILLSHAPPLGTDVDRLHSGQHVGSAAVRTLVEELQPEVVVCGHIHESYGVTDLGNSRIVNCGSAADGRYAWIQIGDKIVVETRSRMLGGTERERAVRRT